MSPRTHSQPAPLACRVRAGLLLLLLLVATEAAAQRILPGDERPELPELEREVAPVPRLLLPPLPPSRLDAAGMGLQRALRLRAIELRGSSVFDAGELQALVASWLGRPLGAEDLIELRDAITRHYVEHGFATSGAVIGDQTVRDGVLRIDVIEGRLEAIDIEPLRHFAPGYLRERIARGAGVPLHTAELARELQLLQEDERVERLEAALRPGSELGRSRLELALEEASPYALRLRGSNHRSPALGGEVGELELGHLNLLGRGDELWLVGARAHGLAEWDVRYGVPLGPWQTRLELRARGSRGEVVDGSLGGLDADSSSSTYSLGLRQPLYRSPGLEIWTGLRLDRRRARTVLSDDALPLETTLRRSRLSVLRWQQDLTWRGRDHVLALRSMLSRGLGARHALDSAGGEARFLSWLGQAQWIRRLPASLRHAQLVARADVQLASQPLASIEKLGIGGAYSVRGYRENALVSDTGWIASLELRVPVLSDARGRDRLQLAPFVDAGGGRDRGGRSDTLIGAGIGLRLRLGRARLAAYWGGRVRASSRMRDRGRPARSAPQDHGFHVALEVDAF